MAKNKKNVSREIEASEGNRAINKFRIGDAVMMLIIVILCLTCVLPFINLAAKSISSNSAVLSREVFLLPKDITFDAYVSLFKDGSMVYAMGYSVVVTAIFTVLGMLVCTCAAYPLSKRRLKGRSVLTFLLMFPMYFSAGLIPTYLLMRDLHLLDTMWVLILPLIYSPYNMLIMKTYLQSSIPDSLEESAFLDGASNFQILFKIVLPLSKPIIATLSLFYAVGRWNNYFWPMVLVPNPQYQPLQVFLRSLLILKQDVGGASAQIGISRTAQMEQLKYAAIIVSVLPILFIYPFIQKYFVKGVSVGAVKE